MKVIKQADKLIIELDHQAEVVALRWAVGDDSRRRDIMKEQLLQTKHTEASAKVLLDIQEKLYNTFVAFELPLAPRIDGPAYCADYDVKAQAVIIDHVHS